MSSGAWIMFLIRAICLWGGLIYFLTVALEAAASCLRAAQERRFGGRDVG